MLRSLDLSWDACSQMTFGLVIAVYALSEDKDKVFDGMSQLMDVFEVMSLNIEKVMRQQPGMSDQEAMDVSLRCSKSLSNMTGLNELGMVILVNFLMNVPLLWVAYVQKLISVMASLAGQLSPYETEDFCEKLADLHSIKYSVLVRKVRIGALRENSVSFRTGEEWAKKATQIFFEGMSSRSGVEASFKKVCSETNLPWMH